MPDSRWEEQCLERLRRGEREALSDIYRVYAPRLFERVLLPLLGDRAAAEDALAETFRSALEAIDRFEPRPGGLLNWLGRIARNKAMDIFRARQRTRQRLCRFQSMLEVAFGSRLSLEDEIDDGERRELLRRTVGAVLERLNPRYRLALELRFFQDRPRVECASRLEITVENFDVLLLRALRAFRRGWENTQKEGSRDG